MVRVRECIRKMVGYIPGEPSEKRDVVKLNQNENRYPPSPKVAEAIAGAVSNLDLYPDSSSRAVRLAAAKVYGTRPEEVMVTNGSDEMLRILFHCCCDPRDVAVAFYPSYTYYDTLAAMFDVDLRHVDFRSDFQLPEKLDMRGVKLAFLPNPNAPTGILFPEKEVRRFIESVTDGLAVVDEAYADYSGYSAIPLLKEYDHLVLVRTFSKSYALAGFRIGLGFAREESMFEFEKVRDYYNLDRLAQAGAEAALLDQEWLRKTSSKIIVSRERTIAAVRKLGLTVYDSAANFILIRCADPAEAERIFLGLRDRDVLVRYFRNRDISDCLRVSIGTEADMDVFLRELADVMRR